MVYPIRRFVLVLPGIILFLFFFFFFFFFLFIIIIFIILFFFILSFSPLSIGITSLRKEGANLSAFRTFVRFALVWFCLFSLPLGVWEELRLVVVALPGLFSNLFFQIASICLVRLGSCASSVKHTVKHT